MEVRAAEISSILKQQIESFDTKAELKEVGQVLSVKDGIAVIYGLDEARAGEMVEFTGGLRGMNSVPHSGQRLDSEPVRL